MNNPVAALHLNALFGTLDHHNLSRNHCAVNVYMVTANFSDLILNNCVSTCLRSGHCCISNLFIRPLRALQQNNGPQDFYIMPPVVYSKKKKRKHYGNTIVHLITHMQHLSNIPKKWRFTVLFQFTIKK